jgi:hypothetical protein
MEREDEHPSQPEYISSRQVNYLPAIVRIAKSSAMAAKVWKKRCKRGTIARIALKTGQWKFDVRDGAVRVGD